MVKRVIKNWWLMSQMKYVILINFNRHLGSIFIKFWSLYYRTQWDHLMAVHSLPAKMARKKSSKKNIHLIVLTAVSHPTPAHPLRNTRRSVLGLSLHLVLTT